MAEDIMNNITREGICHIQDNLPLDNGAILPEYDIAYQSYGRLNAAHNNAILLCHALTGDQYAAGKHPVTGKSGWWQNMIGPGRPLDTDHFFIICSNIIGSCQGSTGPSSINTKTSKPWAMSFPVLTIADMTRAQHALVETFGISRLHAIVGGSMGGMQALAFAKQYPDSVDRAIIIASAAKQSAQNIAFHEVGRQAIMADQRWRNGNYYNHDERPTGGLAVARMAAHITYLSEQGLTKKFGRTLQNRNQKSFGFDADFQIESYLRHQGISFTDRFDANSYLYITRAMDYFDLAESHDGQLSLALAAAKNVRFCLISFDTDWLYPTNESRAIVRALHAIGAKTSFVELKSAFGHDAFLLKNKELGQIIDRFLIDGRACTDGYKHEGSKNVHIK